MVAASRPFREPRLRRPARRRRHRKDGGHLAAFEAAFVGLLLVSSVGFIMALEDGAPPPRAARASVEDLLTDLLAGIHDLPTAERYTSQLERLVAKSVLGNATSFNALRDRALPDWTECRLWIDNGHERRLLFGPSDRLARESVSTSRLWRPEWTYALMVPSLDVVSELQPLEFQGYGVAQGSLVKEHGVPVVASVTTAGGVYQRASVTSLREAPTASLYLQNQTAQPSFNYAEAALVLVNTTVHQQSGPGMPVVPANITVPTGQTFLDVRAVYTASVVSYTLTLTSPNGVPYAVAAVGSGTVYANLSIPEATPGTWVLEGTGSVTGSLLAPASSSVTVRAQALSLNHNWTFVVQEEAHRPMPAGTTLTVRFPSTFSGLEQTNLTQAGWRNIRPVLSLEEGYVVTAELASDLAGGSRGLTVVGKRPANADALYLVRAELGNGTYARSAFVLGQTSGVTSTTNELQRGPYLSVPKPMAPGSTATWGVVFSHATSAAGTSETVTKVDLRTADGSPLFANVTGLVPSGGGWVLRSPSHLQWTGSVAVAANTAATFAARVTVLDANSTHEPAHRLPLSFDDGVSFEAPDQARPHVHTINVPPPENAFGQPQRGYKKPLMTGSVPRGESNASVDWYVRGVRASGESPYQVSSFPALSTVQEALRLGLARSHLNLSSTTVQLGQTVEVALDFRALLEVTLPFGSTISGWNTDLAIYDPAQPFEERGRMQPSWRGSFGANLTLVPEAIEVDAIAPWLLTASSVRSSAAANVTFLVPQGSFYGPHAVVAQTHFLINDGLGNTLPQTARLLGVIDVLPDSGQSETALYWVTLECWLPDW